MLMAPALLSHIKSQMFVVLAKKFPFIIISIIIISIIIISLIVRFRVLDIFRALLILALQTPYGPSRQALWTALMSLPLMLPVWLRAVG